MDDAGSRGSWTVRIGALIAAVVMAPWILWTWFIAGLRCDELCANAQGGDREGWQWQSDSWQWAVLAVLPVAIYIATVRLIGALWRGRYTEAAWWFAGIAAAFVAWLALYLPAVRIWS